MALANVELTNTFDEWRTRTNQLVVQGEQTLVNVSTLFTRVDNGNLWANSVGTRSNTYADSVGVRANTYADSVGVRANTYADSVGLRANTYANSVGVRANTYSVSYADAVGIRANNYSITYADAVGIRANNFATSAVAGEAALARSATNLTSGTIPVARVSGNYNLITGLGTITSGTWNASIVGLLYGGTGSSLNASQGGVVYGTSAGMSITGAGGSGQLLQSSATGAPSWVSPTSLTVSRSSTTGTADNSNALSGYTLQFGNVNGVAGRDGAGDITGRLFRAEYPDQSTISGAIAYRTNNTSDNYTRYCSSPAAVRDWLGAGYTLLGAIATNTGSSFVGFAADFSTYKKLFVSAVDVSHNGGSLSTSPTRTFQIYSASDGTYTPCSQGYKGNGFWRGYVDLDLYSGIGVYADDGATVNANWFRVYTYSGGIYFNTSGGNGFDYGTIYVWGAR